MKNHFYTYFNTNFFSLFLLTNDYFLGHKNELKVLWMNFIAIRLVKISITFAE